jgi:hypothetical protein
MSTNTTPRLRQVFYVSRSLAAPGEVEHILQSARRQNGRRGVTGSLLFTGGHFAQWLEGPADALSDTMATITADIRHDNMKRLIESDIAQRRFSGWDMAFAEAPGVDDLIQELLALSEVPRERAERVLGLMFKPPAT